MYHFVIHDSAGTFIREMVNGPNDDLAVGLMKHPEVNYYEWLFEISHDSRAVLHFVFNLYYTYTNQKPNFHIFLI